MFNITPILGQPSAVDPFLGLGFGGFGFVPSDSQETSEWDLTTRRQTTKASIRLFCKKIFVKIYDQMKKTFALESNLTITLLIL